MSIVYLSDVLRCDSCVVPRGGDGEAHDVGGAVSCAAVESLDTGDCAAWYVVQASTLGFCQAQSVGIGVGGVGFVGCVAGVHRGGRSVVARDGVGRAIRG